MPFVPGQLVKCVDASPSRLGRRLPIARGTVYTVSEVDHRLDQFGEQGVDLVEAPHPYIRGGNLYRASRFVPVDDKALDIFRQVLTDAPKDMETV